MDNMENKDLQNTEEVVAEIVEEIPYVEAEPVTPAKKPNPTLAIISMVCGILGVLFSCCCTWISAPLFIASIIMAFLAPKNENGKRSGMAVAGLIIGIVGLVLLVGMIIINLVFGLGSGILSMLMEQGVSETPNVNDYYYYY